MRRIIYRVNDKIFETIYKPHTVLEQCITGEEAFETLTDSKNMVVNSNFEKLKLCNLHFENMSIGIIMAIDWYHADLIADLKMEYVLRRMHEIFKFLDKDNFLYGNSMQLILSNHIQFSEIVAINNIYNLYKMIKQLPSDNRNIELLLQEVATELPVKRLNITANQIYINEEMHLITTNIAPKTRQIIIGKIYSVLASLLGIEYTHKRFQDLNIHLDIVI